MAIDMVDIPSIRRKPWGIICLVMNILVPGTGTMIMAGNMEEVKQFVFGVLQFVLGFLAIGWIWSVVWGVLIFIKSD